MKRLVVTTDTSGAGHLKQAKIADRVYAVGHRLVSDRAPTMSETSIFFARRSEAHDESAPHWLDGIGAADAHRLAGDRPGLIDICAAFDSIELWVDPVPNAQLILLHLLDFLSSHVEIVGKLVLCHADSRIGGWGFDSTAVGAQRRTPVGVHHLETAILAWDAFRQPDPERWFDLLTMDLQAFPYLRRSVLEFLDELPAVGTALRASEMKLLRLTMLDRPKIESLLRATNDSIFNYWEVGQMLDGLGRSRCPAILGIEDGPFTLELHDDGERFQRYHTSRLSLSELGQALVEGRDDFSRHNEIHCWWGGTELTNDRLWRWNAQKAALVPPA